MEILFSRLSYRRRHNLNGTYQYLYIILRSADTLEDLTDNSGRYTEKIIYERKPIGPDRVSPHIWLLRSIIFRVAGMYIIPRLYLTTLHGGSVHTALPVPVDDPMTDP